MRPHSRMRAVIVGTLLAVLAGLGLVTASTAGAATGTGTTQSSILGGDQLYSSGGASCTIGFNARSSSTYFGILSEPCGAVGTQWYADPFLSTPVGEMHYSDRHYSLIRYTSTQFTYPSAIRSGSSSIRINGTTYPSVGQSLCAKTSTTGLLCGTVNAVNMTISYPDGSVYNVFRSSLCSEAGYPLGAVFSGSQALGLTIGGGGNCSWGGASYHLPIWDVLSRHGLSI